MRRMIELAALACVPVLCLVVAVGCPGPSGGGGGGGGGDGNGNVNDNTSPDGGGGDDGTAPSTEKTPQDYWQTEGGGTTSQDFSEKPVPAGFFGTGCEEFGGAASFVGAAINEGAVGVADTVVKREEDPIAPSDPVGTTNIVDIEIVELSMVSEEPITVICDGAPTLWDVRVELSDTPAPKGTLEATKTYENGGTAESTLFVLPKLIFTSRDDPSIEEKTLDAGAENEDPVEFHALIPWVHALDPNDPAPETTFVLGVDGSPGALKAVRQAIADNACDFITCEQGLTCNSETGECCDPVSGACATGAVEIDRFDFSAGDMTLRLPTGATETIAVEGPAVALVFFEGSVEGVADSDDGDDFDEVPIEMVLLDLRGNSPTLGEVRVGLNPDLPSTGEIEEQTNNTPGTLDLPPFTETGLANSYFDMYFEVEVGGFLYHTLDPKRMSSVIESKPPGPGAVYENVEDIQLYDADGNATDYFLSGAQHRPAPAGGDTLIPCLEHLNPGGTHLHNTCSADTDGDGVPDGTDNCRFDSNPDQADSDGDTFGNACDPAPDDPQVPSGDCGDCVNVLDVFIEALFGTFDCTAWETCLAALETCVPEECTTLECIEAMDCNPATMPACAEFMQWSMDIAEQLENTDTDFEALMDDFTDQGCDRCDPRLFEFDELSLPECLEDMFPDGGFKSKLKKWLPSKGHARSLARYGYSPQ